jgi:ABC-2 type transport system permease protein
VRAAVVKDYYMLRRDLRNMSQLVTPLILGIVYAVMFLRSDGQLPPGRGEAPEWFIEMMRNLMVYGNVGISLFVGWMLLARLGGMGFSQEGKNYWILKTAPVSANQLILAKFLVAYLPALVLGWLFLAAINLMQRSGLETLLFTLPVVALCTAGSAGLSLAFGIAGANMSWEDPRQMIKSSTGCLSTLASIVFLISSLALFFGPPLAFTALSLSQFAGKLTGLILGGFFCVACGLLPLWLVRGRAALLGEA